MRFLIDANLPRSTAGLLARFGHEAVDVRDVLPGGASDNEVARYAQSGGLVLLTRDFDFADVRNYPPADYSGLVVFDLPDDTVASGVLKALESLLAQAELISRLAARLAIVEPGRVRLRPA